MNPRVVELRAAGWQFPSAIVGVVVALGYGIALWQSADVGSEAAAIGVLALVLAVVVLAEWPRAVVFDVDGVERRSLLKRHRIPWGEVDSLERLPVGLVAGLDALTGHEEPRRRGLMLRTIRGNVYVLTAATESAEQRRALKAAVQQWAPYCRMHLLR